MLQSHKSVVHFLPWTSLLPPSIKNSEGTTQKLVESPTDTSILPERFTEFDFPAPQLVEPVRGVHTYIPLERIPDDRVLQPGACEPPCKKQCTGIQVQQIAAQYAEIDAGARAIDHSLLNKPGLAILVQACGAASSIPDWTHCDAPGKNSTMGACVAHEVGSARNMDPCVARGTCTSTRREDELDKDLQANLSLLRLELRELSKGDRNHEKMCLEWKSHQRERRGLCQATTRREEGPDRRTYEPPDAVSQRYHEVITVAEKIENTVQPVVGLGFHSSISGNVDHDALGRGFVERGSQQIPRHFFPEQHEV